MKRVVTAIVLSLLLSGWAIAQDDSSYSLRPSKVRWLVKFESNVSESEITALASELRAEVIGLGPYADFVMFYFTESPDDQSVERLQSHEAVVYAEEEARYLTSSLSSYSFIDDPLQPLQWSHRMINLSTAHYFSFGADPSVTIAVLDTGVAYLNTGDRTMAPDLEGTIVYQGYDFVSDDGIAVDEGDGNIGHGTFLAGVVAQTTFNSHGSAGIAFNASILPVRVANRRGVAKAGDLARGIRYAVAGGASIILVGIAGPSDSRAVREAIELANRLNVAVIAPAGNSQEVRFPARYSQVLSVGAVDAAGKPAYYSPEEGPIDIYAPGGDIRNGVDSNDDGYPDGIIAESFRGRDFNSYEAIMLEGTSAAAAHVAGVAALLMSNEGVMTPDSLYRALRSGARILDGLPVLDAGKTLLRSNRLTR